MISDTSRQDASLHVIGIGASAGGIESFKNLLIALGPAPLDAALVFITHLSPSSVSRLPEVFSTVTSMPVVAVSAKTKVEANTVYVNTERCDTIIKDEHLLPTARADVASRHYPIDLFFESLAAERRDRAVAVLLSGSGADGTLGLHAIQNAQGQALGQTPESTGHDGMVRSAMDSGFVDQLLSVDSIAAQLRKPDAPAKAESKLLIHEDEMSDADDDAVLSIMALLNDECGVDFLRYKRASVTRRITHAMQQAKQSSLTSYAEFLRGNKGALSKLFASMLIHVTSFFRDPLAFEALRHKVFPEIFRQRRRDIDAPVRIWVPGCSTGEEAYSLAIFYHEYAEAHGYRAPLQLFATDLSESVIATARAGVYSETVRSTISKQLAEKYFTGAPASGRIINVIRSSCVFSRHHVIDDPPFSRLDLITCRNLLIYLEPSAQARALSVFHYALRNSGFLLLGRSESAASASDLFAEVDRTTKIYHRLPSGSKSTMRMRRAPTTNLLLPQPSAVKSALGEDRTIFNIDATVAAILNPAGVIVDGDLKIIDFRGNIGAILAPVAGRAVLTLARMAPARLASSVRKLVYQVNKEGGAARQGRVTFVRDGERCTVDVGVAKLPEQIQTENPLFFVLFSGLVTVAKSQKASGRPSSDAEISATVNRLESELESSHEHVRALTDDYQHATHALNSLNEELLSGNEELQSLNEELETAKEELESGNEELSTLNDELQTRNADLGEVNSDLLNIMSTIDIPLIIIDRNRRIRRFTAESCNFINCIPSDTGRRVDDLHINFERPGLLTDIQHVIEHGVMVEFQIAMPVDEWYNVQIRPYVSVDGLADGAVIAFVRITALKNLIAEVEDARDWARYITDAVPKPLITLDPGAKIISVNDAFTETLGVSRGSVIGHSIFDIAGGALRSSELHALLENASKNRHEALRTEIKLASKARDMQLFDVMARSIPDPSGAFVVIVSFEDTTEQRAAERQAVALAEERQSRIEAEKTNQAKDDFLAMLSHELRTPLAAISLRTQLMLNDVNISSEAKQGLKLIEQSARTQSALVEDLLDVSRIVAGKMRLRRDLVSLSSVIQYALDAVSGQAQEKRIELSLRLACSNAQVVGDADRLQQIVGNLLNNAVKFTPSGGRCGIALYKAGSSVVIEVADNGLGLAPDMLETIFERFAQKDSSSSRQHGGLGLGLTIVRFLSELHHGSVDVQSDGIGHGATFRITLPSAGQTPDEAESLEHVSSDLAATDMKLKGRHVLVIDDDQFLRDSIKEALLHAEMVVKVAASANEGLEMLEHFSAQVILCDINMPGNDGYAFIKRLGRESLSRHAGVPVIAITALAGHRDERQIIDAGFTSRIVKPFKITDLLRVVQTAIAEGATKEN